MSVLMVQLLHDLRALCIAQMSAAEQNNEEARAEAMDLLVKRIDFALRNR